MQNITGEVYHTAVQGIVTSKSHASHQLAKILVHAIFKQNESIVQNVPLVEIMSVPHIDNPYETIPNCRLIIFRCK